MVGWGQPRGNGCKGGAKAQRRRSRELFVSLIWDYWERTLGAQSKSQDTLYTGKQKPDSGDSTLESKGTVMPCLHLSWSISLYPTGQPHIPFSALDKDPIGPAIGFSTPLQPALPATPSITPRLPSAALVLQTVHHLSQNYTESHKGHRDRQTRQGVGKKKIIHRQ